MRIQKPGPLSAILALSGALAGSAADWLNDRGDAGLDGWQKHEKALTAKNVGGLKLIWKLKLDGGPVATPVILGHWITNRGTKELVFAVTGENNVYAVDADLGRLFWQRRLEGGSSSRPAAPWLAPGPPPPPGKDEVDDDDDVRQEIRPVYVRAASGARFALHPTTGLDLPRTSGLPPAPQAGSGAARWQDGWVFTAAGTRIAAMQGDKTIWSSTSMTAPLAPVIANGVVYALDGGSKRDHAVLYAFDAKTGRQLYTSGDSILGYAGASGGLAIANGHISFGTADGTLYCFGFPVDL